MKEVRGNLWDHQYQGYIVITTNGFVKSDGTCVMGRGVALQAATRFPTLPKLLGDHLKENGNRLGHFEFDKGVIQLLTFPVKEVWWKTANPELIQRSCQDLLNFIKDLNVKVFMPRPGCQNGKLHWADVKPILEQEFGDDPRITIVDRSA